MNPLPLLVIVDGPPVQVERLFERLNRDRAGLMMRLEKRSGRALQSLYAETRRVLGRGGDVFLGGDLRRDEVECLQGIALEYGAAPLSLRVLNPELSPPSSAAGDA